jgi:hypothetical protein
MADTAAHLVDRVLTIAPIRQWVLYTDDVDLNKKLATWEDFYNFSRPHGAHGGRAPYEALKSMLG